jgi:hypothetical protein
VKTIERGIVAPARYLGSRGDDVEPYGDGRIVERLRSDLAA